MESGKAPGPNRLVAQIAVVLICTGMRINELLRLPAADVHLQDGYAIGGEKTVAGKGRVIPLPPPIHGIIAEWLSVGAPVLVASKAGTALDDSNVRRRFSKLMDELGIEGVTPHTCRPYLCNGNGCCWCTSKGNTVYFGACKLLYYGCYIHTPWRADARYCGIKSGLEWHRSGTNHL